MRFLGKTISSLRIKFKTTSNRTAEFVPTIFDTVIFYAKNRDRLKFRRLFRSKDYEGVTEDSYGCVEVSPNFWRRLTRSEKDNPRRSGPLFGLSDLTSSHEYTREPFQWFNRSFGTRRRYWSTSHAGMTRLGRANRLCDVNGTLRYKRLFDDTSIFGLDNIWHDLGSGSQTEERTYVVQTLSRVIQRCILMATDPGDLVLDPTCGSGTTAYVAEQWGRRWITIDTSRVALALARARVMGARYPWYILADSRDGQVKEAEISRRDRSQMPTYGNVRQGFVYERVPHITLRDIANNAEIDVIYEEYQRDLEPVREALNAALERQWEEWEIPREPGDPWPEGAVTAWLMLRDESDVVEKARLLGIVNRELDRNYAINDLPEQPRDEWEPEANELHWRWWELRIARQQEIDASIAAHAEYEYLYDKPYADNSKVRVAGPFTVESISPHRVLGVDENGDVLDGIAEPRNGYSTGYDFGAVILDNLRRSGVQQAHREDRINFTSLMPWPGRLVCAEGKYVESAGGDEDDDNAMTGPEKRAGIFIGPEFGTVSRPDLVEAAREAAECGFDVLIACAFQLRRPHHRVREPGPCPRAQGPHERRPAHGRRAEEHRQRQPVRHLRRARHRHPGGRGRPDPGAGQRRGRVPSQHRRGAQRRAGGHRLLVHRHRLQPGELLRPSRLLPGRQRPVPLPQNHPESRNRRRRLGYPAQRHLAPLPQARNRPHRRQG